MDMKALIVTEHIHFLFKCQLHEYTTTPAHLEVLQITQRYKTVEFSVGQQLLGNMPSGLHALDDSVVNCG